MPEPLRRLRSCHALKGIGIPAFMAVFFCGYFFTLEHPLRPVTLMPAGPIDRLIPFQPGWVWIYCSLWLYVALPPVFLTTAADLFRYARLSAALALCGLATFFLWPTAIVPQGTGFLKAVDRNGNAFPSLHAAFAVFTVLALDRLLREFHAARWLRWANLLWCLAILYSTLAAKQHVLSDILAGSLLGLIAAWANTRARRAKSDASAALLRSRPDAG